MSMTSEQYRDQMIALAPTGAALPTELDSVWVRLLWGIAGEFSRVDARSDDLLNEVDPRTALEALEDWERVCALPGECSQASETIQERREAVLLVLTAQGGQSAEYYEEMAAALGVEATVEEYRPFRAGRSTAGDPLTNGDWIFTWCLRAPATTIKYFRAASSAAGDPLAKWGNAAFECYMSRIAPAHTILIFAYGEE